MQSIPGLKQNRGHFKLILLAIIIIAVVYLLSRAGIITLPLKFLGL